MAIKIILLVVFFGIMLTIGFLTRKNATDVSGFVLGGRSVGPWLTAFAYGTSYFSAVIFVGYAGQFGWKFGISSTWVGIGNALLGSLLAWVVLGRRTRIMTQHLHSATMPDFFARRFGSESLKIVSSIVIFIFLIPYTASLYNGLSRLFEMAFGIPYFWCVLVMSVLTAVYVIAGGYMATAINDFIQGLIMIVGIVAVIAAVLGKNGGFLGSLNGLAAISDERVSSVPGIFNSFFGPDPLSLLGVVILTSLGTWGLPQMVGKFYAIKSEGDIHKGTIISTAFAVVIILVLSASMSTLSSLVLTSSSTVTLDLLKGHVIRNMEEKKQLLIMRSLIVVFIAISAVIAIIQVNSPVAFIAQAMGVSWGAMAGAFLAPFLYGLYFRGTSRIACWINILFSCVFMTVDMLSNLGVLKLSLGLLQSPINAGAFCMLLGLVLVPLISLITPKPDRAIVENAFSCYEKKVLVRQTSSLED